MTADREQVRRDAETPIVTERITDDDCPCLKPSHRDLEARLEQAERERDEAREVAERAGRDLLMVEGRLIWAEQREAALVEALETIRDGTYRGPHIGIATAALAAHEQAGT